MRPSGTTAVTLGYAAMCLIWSSTWIAIKLGLQGAPPMTAVALRFIIAGLLVLFIIRLRRVRIPMTRDFARLGLFLSIFHIGLPYVLVYWCEQYISSGLTAVLYSTVPIDVAIFARVLLGDALTPRKLAGAVIGFAGVAVIFSDHLSIGGNEALLAITACLASALCAGLSSVVIKKYAFNYDPFVMLAATFTIGGTLVAAAAVPVEASNPLRFSAGTWGTILYLAILGSVVAFAIYFWVIKRIDVTVLSYQNFIIPVLAVVMGWIFLGEKITMRVAVGAGCIVAGIALATLRTRLGGITTRLEHDART